jgi:type IV pilus assembly protein PilE
MENKVKGKQTGFSLIELMIVVGVIGIIAMIAYPAYTDYVTEARRAQGQSLLLGAQLSQERYRSYNNTYATTAASLTAANLDLPADDYYAFTTVGSASTYTVTATATGIQLANDGACSPLTLNQNNDKGPNDDCWQN